MTYHTKLQVFEGPLDLLIYLIKKNELDIYDIPIAEVTEQYLEYLDWMQILDLSIAGEFLVMAATLMHIKSKMLLPPEETEPEEEEIDPREELVRRLLEYQAFKEAAGMLDVRRHERDKLFTRPAKVESAPVSDAPSRYFEASLFDLIAAFSTVLKDVPKEAFHQIIQDEATVEEKVHELLHLLVQKPRLMFLELFTSSRNKVEVIATFLAVLELIRLKEIVVRQEDVFGDIEVIRNDKKAIVWPHVEVASSEVSEGSNGE